MTTTDSPALAMVTGTNPEADGFWTALSRHVLQVRVCTRCGTRYVLPLPTCPDCGGEPELKVSSGRGRLYTWVVVRYAFDDVLAQQVPYIVGNVELEEGGRVFGRVEGIEIDDLEIDLPVRATFPSETGRPPIVFVPQEA
jgi:uncharacterized OB-fold protein